MMLKFSFLKFGFGYAGSSLPCGFLSSCGEQGLLSSCGGFSCCGTWALGCMGSVVAALGLSSCGSRAPEHGLNSCGVQALGSSQIRD